jgi:hypothetical protein
MTYAQGDAKEESSATRRGFFEGFRLPQNSSGSAAAPARTAHCIGNSLFKKILENALGDITARFKDDCGWVDSIFHQNGRRTSQEAKAPIEWHSPDSQ